ncbi:hypothetical protein BDV25DRAFT_137091 [Aspergillus avenaceus]|uniref:Lysine-specific metallo-endopeptidase domain-containing protein n=1 Tax=Aspergillus avenaceus TaxID=36643 RepID=A0A5N6U447_ASPAV|nr:hypothetical protein BDV25DRAFT_137091 [Aspergillus avenaceus]
MHVLSGGSLLAVLLFSWPLLVHATIGSIFKLKTEKGERGTCHGQLDTLDTWLSESKALADAALQAFEDAGTESHPHQGIARRYLASYFGLDSASPLEDQTSKRFVIFIKKNSRPIEPPPGYSATIHGSSKCCETMPPCKKGAWTPTWKFRPAATCIRSPLKTWSSTAALCGISTTGSGSATGRIPYWSQDLLSYVFDRNYNGKAFCTAVTENGDRGLAATQDTTNPSTMTFCPFSFEMPTKDKWLGSRMPMGHNIVNVTPRSATSYHETFHLVLGMISTLDFTYDWMVQRKAMRQPNAIPDGFEKRGTTDIQLIRQNPQTAKGTRGIASTQALVG